MNSIVMDGYARRMDMNGMFFEPRFFTWFNFPLGIVIEITSAEEQAEVGGAAIRLTGASSFLPVEFEMPTDLVILRANKQRTRLKGNVTMLEGFEYKILHEHEVLYHVAMKERRKARPYTRPPIDAIASGSAVGEMKVEAGVTTMEQTEFASLGYDPVPADEYVESPGYFPMPSSGYTPEASPLYSPLAPPNLERTQFTLESPGYFPEAPAYVESPGYKPLLRPHCVELPGYSLESPSYTPEANRYVEIPRYIPVAPVSPVTPLAAFSEIVGPIEVPSDDGPLQSQIAEIHSNPGSREYRRRL
ncbi:hypothetical protein R1sor_010639 [Riccia sorocarpa]|uniref:Uncharacterized protein n=1 Tax=Riccia sorocarpa TaxID=122646 RepID=A0ABD3HYW4_9MARC